MKVEDAIAKSNPGLAQRRGALGGKMFAMKIHGALRQVRSIECPTSRGSLRKSDIEAENWQPVS